MDVTRLVDALRHDGAPVSRRSLLQLAAMGSVALGAGAGFTPRRALAGQDAGAPQPGGTWTMAITANPTAYPITAPGALADILVNKTIFNSLVQYQMNGEEIEVVPDLAESWQANPELTEYTFKLKPGVTWHDGAPVTAADVKFTMDAVLDPNVNAAGRGVVSSIKSTEVVDDLTVRFVMHYPYALLPVMLGYNKPICPRHLLEGQDLNQPTAFLQRPVGTGPFRFKEFSQGSYLAVEKNPDYFEGAPLLDGIIFKVIPDGNARVAQVRSGELDFTVIEPPQIDALEGVETVEVRMAPQVNYYFFAINHSNPKFADVRVRQALVHAIDRQALVERVLKGNGAVATGPINPLLGPYHNPNVATYDYDPERAVALLTEAGWNKGEDGVLVNGAGERFTIRFNGPKGFPVMEQVITYAQQAYGDLGFEVELELADWTVHLDQYHDLQYDLLMQWWITPPAPDQYDHYFSESSSNWWGYKNPEVDDLIVRSRSQPDEAQRIELFHQLQAKLAEEVPVVYLYYPQEIQAISTRTRDLPAMGYRDALTWMEKVSVQ